MAVFRIEKNRDYTVMSNHHLRNINLSLKAKGLLSLMLSLPEDWDYTTAGLAKICKDGTDSICSAIKELEQAGHIIRKRIRNQRGQLTTIEYTILEQPIADCPIQEKPKQENPVLDKPILENPPQLNTNQSNIQESNKDLSNIPSLPVCKSNLLRETEEGKGKEITQQDIVAVYGEIVKENIEYDYLIQDSKINKDCLDEMVDLIVETLCSTRKTLCIAGDEYPAKLIKAKFMKLDSSHIRFVLECLEENTTKIRNIKQYLRAALFNAPSTKNSYYTALVNHDSKNENN